MSKRKSSGHQTGSPLSFELDEEQIAALDRVPDSLHPSLKCLVPVLDTIRKAYGDKIAPHRRALPTRQATDFKRTTAAAKALDIDYKEDDISYVFNLKSEYLQDSRHLSEHFASVIKDLKTSDYASVRHDESFCRTVLDLIIMDRLRYLKDKDTYHRLQVSAEVPISIRMTDIYGNNEIVKGRADWALGYGMDKSDTGAILLVIEAKPYESAAVGMPQLLVYMAAVYEARRKQDRINKSVFGMVSDSKEFRFSFLDENKKFSTTRSFTWVTEQSTILAYIDMMLINAIESSPHTTPTKKNNQIIQKFPEFLKRQWSFGTQLDDEEVEDEEDDDSDVVDVLNIGGRIVMKTSMRHGRSNSAG